MPQHGMSIGDAWRHALARLPAVNPPDGEVFATGPRGDVSELPFGCTKGSDHGREKGFVALHGFGSFKTIVIR